MPSSEPPPDWQDLLRELEQRSSDARAMGGPKKLADRRNRHRLNAREVIDEFVDEGSFLELGTLVGGMNGVPADALVGGLAEIDGRPIVVAAEDFTSKGGSIGHGTASKRLRYARLAAQERIPYILFLDGAGYRVSSALERHPYAPNDLQALADLAGQVPTVAVVLGSSAGHSALSGVLMDFVVMLESACLFSAGPPLVAAALGEQSSREQLGGALMHARVSGVCHNLASDEQGAFDLVRRYLDFFPSSAWQRSPQRDSGQSQARRLDDILHLIPRDNQIPYDMEQVIALLVDRDCEPLEIQPLYGASMITTLARLGGQAVGIVANQPTVMAGSVTAEAADKAARFLDICNAYQLPVVFLADTPGICPGAQAEAAGTLRAAARLYAAQRALDTPKLHVTLRKAFGFGSSIMGMNPFDTQTLSLAFPGVNLAGIPAIGGVVAAGEEARREQLEAMEAHAAWSSADTMAYDEIIDPRELRNALLRGLRQASARRSTASGPALKRNIRP